MYRKYINIVEAANKGCPIATYDIEVNSGVSNQNATNAKAVENTKNGGTSADIATIQIKLAGAGACYTDDIIIRDDIWPGRGGIHVLVPDSGSATEDWTASAGDPETCVDELPVSFTDYISTDALVDATVHLFGVAALGSTSAAIRAVGVYAKALTDEATDAFIRTKMVSGGTTSDGTTTGIDTAATWLASYYAVNPDDSAAWEDADIAALEIGVETVVP